MARLVRVGPAGEPYGCAFPTVPDKHGYPSAYRPAAFLHALRAGLPVASAVVIGAVPDQADTAFRMDHQRADGVLRELFATTIAGIGSVVGL